MINFIKRCLNRETIIYIIFGILTTAVDYVAFSLLHYGLTINEIIANTIAWALAVAFAYITNKLFVFESKSFDIKTLTKEIPSFLLARLLSLIVTNIFLVFAAHISMNMLLAKALISVVVIILNYIFSKLFVFKEKNENETLTREDI